MSPAAQVQSTTQFLKGQTTTAQSSTAHCHRPTAHCHNGSRPQYLEPRDHSLFGNENARSTLLPGCRRPWGCRSLRKQRAGLPLCLCLPPRCSFAWRLFVSVGGVLLLSSLPGFKNGDGAGDARQIALQNSTCTTSGKHSTNTRTYSDCSRVRVGW
jgi:hypothetical protein